MDGKLFHLMQKVNGSSTRSSLLLSEIKNKPGLGVSIGLSTMRYKPLLMTDLSTYRGPKVGSIMSTSLMRRSSDQTHYIADRAYIDKFSAFRLE